MSLAECPDSSRQHLGFYSAVIVEHNKAESSLQATPEMRTAKSKRLDRAQDFRLEATEGVCSVCATKENF